MTVTAPHEGSRPLAESALGVIAGTVAPVAYCAVAVPLVRRLGALGGSLTALVVWAAVAWAMVATALYLVFGARRG